MRKLLYWHQKQLLKSMLTLKNQYKQIILNIKNNYNWYFYWNVSESIIYRGLLQAFLGFKRYETILELYVLYYIDIWDELLQTKSFSGMLLRKKHSHMVFLAFSEMNFVHTENHWKSIFCIIVADGKLKSLK